MKIETTNQRAQDMLALACGGCVTLIIILIMNKDYPWVGHDYSYFISRLIDTGLHIRINGLTIQWYTPSFGGGLPAFPNPQHMEYSIVQLLSLWINPWSAVLVSTAGISLVGYWFFYKFLKERLELNWMSSTLGAMFFIGNGFYIQHLIAGQVGYQLFPLGAIILYALTDNRNRRIYNGAIIAIVIALMVFQAGFYLIVILALSLSITLPILYLYKPEILNVRNITLTAISSFVLSATISSSKIYAVAAFMSHFPRQIFDAYPIGCLQAGLGLIVQMLGTMILAPIFLATQNDPALLTGTFSMVTGAGYGLWETDIGLPPVLTIFLLTELARAVGRFRKNTRINLKRATLSALILLALPVWITIEMTLARGIIYTLTKQLPILRSLHVNVRFAAAFVIPLVIIGAFQLHRFFLQNPKRSYFATLALLTIVALFSFFSFSKEVHIRQFNVSLSNYLHEKIQRGSRFPVTAIEDISPWVGFAGDGSSIKPYEPIFGYKLEEFNHQLHLGSVFEKENDYFNMTNPEGYVFPEINNLQPFERFKLSEQNKLEAFLERRQPGWNIPVMQRVLNGLSLVALIFTLGVLLAANITNIKTTIGNKN